MGLVTRSYLTWKSYKAWVRPGPIDIMGQAHNGNWNNYSDRPHTIIILDVKRFKIRLEPGPIPMMGSSLIIIFALKMFKVWTLPEYFNMF